ncbi:Meiosis protein [Lachnellula hyalina]|uniref:Meiosis protein n=1 Tax=Lachnellula hyalina TaxID=1316788 RepID=A0A8H8QUG8_9HELO|nr:Meiosis protein [Lachnellula hyalina]TVY23003.1 Meiosis protein [Lachnellula hyalina]
MSRATGVGGSPMSSSLGSHNSRVSTFSSQDVRSTQRAPTKNMATLVRDGNDDPFVIDDSKPKGEAKLSATASDFKPFALRGAPRVSSPSTDDKALKYLREEIENNPNTAVQGAFTTDIGKSRCIKVSSVYGEDTRSLVDASLEKMMAGGFWNQGSRRISELGNVVYLRLSNIMEAVNIYDAIKEDNIRSLQTDYIHPRVWAQIVSPLSLGNHSAHEGQVVLRTAKPLGMSSRQFEDRLLKCLSTEGPLVAWQMLPLHDAPFPAVYTMIAEYYDSSLASWAVTTINGSTIGKKEGYPEVQVSLIHHRPDLKPKPMSNALGQSVSASPSMPAHLFNDGHSFARARVDMAISNQTPSHHYIARGGTMPLSISPSTIGSLGNAFGSISLRNHTRDSTPLGSGSMASPFGTIGPGHLPAASQFGGNNAPLPVMMDMGMGVYSPVTPTQQVHNTYQPFNHLGRFAHPQAPNPYGHYGQTFGSPDSMHQINSPPSMKRHGRADFSYSSPSPGGFSRDLTQSTSNSVRRQNAQKISNYPRCQHNPAASQHNHVDISSIEQGKDVRTTVMLRNIPNKFTLKMLKEFIDESSFGTYDFVYLRIDFLNKCNVGYAFINFVDPLDIINFVRARAGQKWDRFQSEKIAQISYATIQGRDCLIQKFRNSSVMLEEENYRPKLYYTLADGEELAGTEEEFPQSDNSSKLQRSCQNAEQMGLFAPNAGQQVRADQRQRRSLYDRGNSLAERDKFYSDAYDNSESRGLGRSGYRASY